MDSDKALMLSAKEALGIGEIFVKSGFFGDTHAAAQAAVKILAGRELGIGPFAAMTGIYIVKGRVTLSANLMASRIKASGKYDYRIRTSDSTECLIEFLQKSDDGWISIGTSRFTMKDAVDAQVVANGDNWKKYPRNMLFARAMSNGFKWFTPDLASGAPVFTPEEMGVREGVNPETGEVIEGESAVVDVPVPEPQEEPGDDAGGQSEPEREQTPRRIAPMSNNQKNKLVELYVERFGGTEDEAVQGLDAVFESAFKHPLGEATLAEASKIISKMIERKNGGVKSTTPATAGAITNAVQLLAAIERDQELGDYYTHADGNAASIAHLQGAIRKQLGNAKWGWPRPNDAEGWKAAHGAAVMYAKDQIAQKQAA